MNRRSEHFHINDVLYIFDIFLINLFYSVELSVEQILAVEILQHRFNIEKMVKIAEILLTYSDEGEAGSLQVFFTH